MPNALLSTRAILAGRAPPGVPVTVRGWVRTRRDYKEWSFLNLSDGSAFHPLQVVASRNLPNYASEIVHLTAGCAIEAQGLIVSSPQRRQAYEMQAIAITVVGTVDEPDSYPIQPKPHTLEFLREVAHLRPRTSIISAAARVRHTAAQAIHRFFREREFYWVTAPIITSLNSEGALFRVSTLDFANLRPAADGRVDLSQDFFGRDVYLSRSAQLSTEAYCLALSKVYAFGPTFSAENSNTARHLAEFWTVEPEVAFADLNDSAALAEALLKYTCEAVLTENPDDMAFFEDKTEKGIIAKLKDMVDAEFARVDYGEAVAVLESAERKFEMQVAWGMDIHPEHERYLTEHYTKKPLIVTNYPKATRPFSLRLNGDGQTVAAMEVLVPGVGALVNGGQREERLPVLDDRMTELGIDKARYDWYRDLRRYGSVPHAGFGLGFERMLAYFTGLSNVRDVAAFPRTPGNVRF